MPSRRKPSNFYTVILSGNDNKINLRIPNRFIRGHRKQILLNDVVLVVSDDKIWHFGWMISGDGKLWLQKGWPEFAKHYRIGYGYLLIFKHLSKSIFHVSIFDSSRCEINYPNPPFKFPKLENTIRQIEVNTDLGFQKGEEQSSRNRNRAFRSIKSEYPFYSITIKPSYTRTWGLIVPLNFLRRYLTRDKDRVNCVIRTSNGRNWGPIECIRYKTYGKLHGENLKKFHDDNHVRVGDVCVFQLINEIENVLEVTIFRASKKLFKKHGEKCAQSCHL